MKESIKKEPWIKISEINTFYLWSCLSIISLMSALIIGALINYGDMHRYYQKYCTKKEKVEYQVVKCVENEQGDYYLCLRNLKTKKKVIKGCDFNDYTLYEPGDKITYNLTKAQLSDQGEYKIDDKDSKDYLIIRITFCLSIISIICLGFLLCTVLTRDEKTGTRYEIRLVGVTIAYDVLVLAIVVFEYIAL